LFTAHLSVNKVERANTKAKDSQRDLTDVQHLRFTLWDSSEGHLQSQIVVIVTLSMTLYVCYTFLTILFNLPKMQFNLYLC